MTGTSPLLHVEGLCCRYGARTVIEGIDLAIGRGEIVVVLGENGAGKTTLLRAIAGEILPAGGRVTVDGIGLAADPERARARLVYVSQRPPLAPLATLREHAEALVAFRGLDPGAAVADLERLAGVLRLGADVDRPVRALSGGMQHKAALVLGLLAGTPLAVFDEPHTGLDVRSALALRGLIAARRDSGTAFVLASHLAESTLALADRALVIAHGRVARTFDHGEIAGFGGDARAFEAAVLQAMG